MAGEKMLAFFLRLCYDKNPPQKAKSFSHFSKNCGLRAEIMKRKRQKCADFITKCIHKPENRFGKVPK